MDVRNVDYVNVQLNFEKIFHPTLKNFYRSEITITRWAIILLLFFFFFYYVNFYVKYAENM